MIQLRLKTSNELLKMIMTDLMDYKTEIGLNCLRKYYQQNLLSLDEVKACLYVVCNDINLTDNNCKRINLREFFNSL